MTVTTRIFVRRSIWRFHTISEGIGMMMRSMKMLRAQEARMKVRELMHVPPGTTLPSALIWSISGFAHV